MRGISLLRGAAHYWWLGVLVAVACVAVGVALASTQEDRYRATSEIIVTPDRKLGRNLQAVQLVLPTLAQQIDVAENYIATQNALPEELQDSAWTADITTDPQTLVISVNVESAREDLVVPLANTFADQVLADRERDAFADYAVHRPAEEPEPVANRLAPILIGLAIGIALGLLAMLGVQAARPLVRGERDLRGGGVEVLGTVRGLGDLRSASEVMRSGGGAARAFDRIGLAVEAARARSGRAAVAVVSPRDDDGSALAAACLGWGAAVLGNHVDVIEADAGAPSLDRQLGLPARARDDATDAPIRVPGAPGSLAATLTLPGPREGTPAARIGAAIARDREAGRSAILSAPPLSDAANALVAARLAGAAVLVLPSGVYSRRAVQSALSELRDAGTEVLGVVLIEGGRRPGPPEGPGADAEPEPEPATFPRHGVVGGPAAVDPDAEQPELDEPVVGPPPSRAKKTIRNAAYVFLQTGMAPLLNVLILPVLVNELGVVEYGVFATLQAVFVFTSVFDLGLSKSVVKYVAAFWAKGDTEAIARFTSTAFTVYIGLGFLVFVASVGVAVLGVDLLGVPEDLQDQAKIAALVFGTTSFYNFPAGTLGGVLGGLKRHDAESRLHVSIAVLQAVGQAAAAFAGLGLVAVVVAFNAPQYIRPWIRYRIIKRMVPDFRLSPRLFDRATLREIGGYSVWSFLVDLGRNVVGSFGIVVVASFLGAASAASYNIGTQVGRLLQRMTLPVAFVLLPLAAEFDASGDHRSAQRLIERASRYTTAISIALAGPLIVLAPDVIRVWLGEPFPVAVDVARVFLVASVLLMLRAPLSNVLEGSNRGVRTAGLWSGAEIVLSIGFSIALVQVGGARGAVLGVLAAVALVTVVGIVPAALRAYGIPILEYLRTSLLPPLLPLLIAVVPWLGIAYVVHGRGLVLVLAALAASTAVYLLPFWFMLPRRERDDLAPALLGRLGLGRGTSRRATSGDRPRGGGRAETIRR